MVTLTGVSITEVMLQPGGVLSEDLGGDVRRASGNPYPISDQNM